MLLWYNSYDIYYDIQFIFIPESSYLRLFKKEKGVCFETLLNDFVTI